VSFQKGVWDQLKNTRVEAIMKALVKDGWVREETPGAVQAYRKGSARVVIHYHPGKTYGAKFLKSILADIGWSVKDLKRLKLIK